jgi:hypothetical protein
MKDRVKCFEQEIEGETSYAMLEGGIRVVEIRYIVGTVDKCDELDRNFNYIHRKDRHERSRRNRMAQALHRDVFLPPVDLYFFRGEYYVFDGNRRVAAAKEMKIEYIDAHVTEFISRDSVMEMSGALSRRRFEAETNIRTITLTHGNGYDVLLEEAKQYPVNDGTTPRARRWYSERFLPACRRIEATSLPKHYRDLQSGDIYVLINGFYNSYLGGVPSYTHYDTIISGFMFAHGIRQRRFLRFPLFRLVTVWFLRRRLRTPRRDA